jgi:hypothetical protein
MAGRKSTAWINWIKRHPDKTIEFFLGEPKFDFSISTNHLYPTRNSIHKLIEAAKQLQKERKENGI